MAVATVLIGTLYVPAYITCRERTMDQAVEVVRCMYFTIMSALKLDDLRVMQVISG